MYIDGVLVPKEKIQKETARNFVSTIERYQQGNSPYNIGIPLTKPA